MYLCGQCGDKLYKVRRKWWQRIFYKSAYRCRECGVREDHKKRWFRMTISRTCCCPWCGRTELKRLRKMDSVENFKTGFFRTVQKWFGAPLYYCDRCRLQFHDFRRLAAKPRADPALSDQC